ncbi:DUF885 family protein [Winogradskyella sp.]|uniref:DUF885 family protein n=1 Tax=Winogradskyella sp. TaxID=1883156 RepID=UPI00260A521D|nr:DUF885 family protein [Winogradskyella sp.]
MENKVCVTVFALLVLFIYCKPTSQSFDELCQEFIEGYKSLDIPSAGLSFVSNLNNIKDQNSLNAQTDFFNKFREKLLLIDTSLLRDDQKLDFQLLNYEVQLNLERLSLETQWERLPIKDSTSIYHIPNGPEWYKYFLKKWVDMDAKPGDIFIFGEKEITRVKKNLQRIRQSQTNRPFFDDSLNLVENSVLIKKAFMGMGSQIDSIIAGKFPYLDSIPGLTISKNEQASLMHVPAYYNRNVFYYNGITYGQMTNMFVHEASPGHHYQMNVTKMLNRSPVQELFWYPCFIEGWATYIEDLLIEFGAYTSPIQEYGKWEWDLIRSVRMCIDVGVNYYGWSDEKALEFWQKHIEGKDDIGHREINRIKRWPAQSITYKYGSQKIKQILSSSKKQKGFNYLDFHKRILDKGDIPLKLLN